MLVDLPEDLLPHPKVRRSPPVDAGVVVGFRDTGEEVRRGQPLQLSDRAPDGWRLLTEDGTMVATATPALVRGPRVSEGQRMACRSPGG